MKKLLCSIIILAVAGFAHAELINPGFEDYDDMTGWGSWASGSAGAGWLGGSSYYAYIDTTGNGNGSSQNFMNLNTLPMTSFGLSVVWREDDAEIIPVTEGDWVKMGGYFKDLSGTGASGMFSFEWILDPDIISGDGVPTEDPPPTEITIYPTAEWAYYSAWVQAPWPAGSIRPVWGVNSPGSEIGIDDLEFVPEPMSIALLGLGALALRRRK